MAAAGEAALEPGRGQAGYASARRIFRILDRVSRGGRSLTAKRLAQELGISLSTCYQLVAILIDEGYVEKLPHHAGYRLGPTVTMLHEHAERAGVESVIDPILVRLGQRAHTSAYFGVLSGAEVVFTHVQCPPNSPPVGVSKGFRGPAHALALGKMLIAGAGLQAIDDFVGGHRLEAFTRRTITDPARLEAELKEARRRGFATDFEEFAKNLYCVAVPVPGEEGVRGAIGLSTVAGRSAGELNGLIRLARAAAAEAAAAL